MKNKKSDGLTRKEISAFIKGAYAHAFAVMLLTAACFAASAALVALWLGAGLK